MHVAEVIVDDVIVEINVYLSPPELIVRILAINGEAQGSFNSQAKPASFEIRVGSG
jgi:hypothetical protein